MRSVYSGAASSCLASKALKFREEPSLKVLNILIRNISLANDIKTEISELILLDQQDCRHIATPCISDFQKTLGLAPVSSATTNLDVLIFSLILGRTSPVEGI